MSRLTERLQEQSAKLGVRQIDIAQKLGVTQQAINNLFNGRAGSTAYWREIGEMLSISDEEMHLLMFNQGRVPSKGKRAVPVGRTGSGQFMTIEGGDDRPIPNAKILENQMTMTLPGRMLPVLGEAVGGEDGEYIFNGQVLDYVACPPSLVNVPNAYSVYVDGESMYPRFKSGETVYVHPSKPPRRGDDVIVQVHPQQEDMPPRGYIKEFVGWTGSKLILQQHNPVKRIEFERDEIVSVHPIILSGKYA